MCDNAGGQVKAEDECCDYPLVLHVLLVYGSSGMSEIDERNHR